jgi:hypothetical protein
VECGPTAAAPVAFEADPDFAEEARPYVGYDVVAGVACIQVEGMLVQKLGTLRPYSGMTGYDGLRTNFLTAVSDPDVRAIVLDINSPGGEVSGCFELSDTIYASRGLKPIVGHLRRTSLIPQRTRSRALRTGCWCRGSAGPEASVSLTMVVDYSKAISNAGLTVHFVNYGDAKAAELRQMHTGVQPELLDRIAQDIAVMGDLFVATVARNREAWSAAAIQGAAG